MKKITGGVCAPEGFTAGAVHCGIRKNRTKKDLTLIFSEVTANAAAVYTTNLVKGAPIDVTRSHLTNGKAQAMICNSGNANTCNANGIEIAEKTCQLTASALGILPEDVIVASTGVIGEPMDIAPFEKGIPPLAAALSRNGGKDAAEGIMTTDRIMKESAVEFELGGKVCHLGGIAKGSGMIHPNMATMLIFLTTDAAISSEMLQKALSEDVQKSFNMISIDGDMSTNDMASIMANGLAGNPEITSEGPDFDTFAEALDQVTVSLSRMLAGDGEGAGKLIECKVSGAQDVKTARVVARSVISSSLVKAAMFGADANWGRILCAIGYSGADLDVHKIDVSFENELGKIDVCKNGAGIAFSEEKAKEVLLGKEIGLLVDLNSGSASATAWGCDLTYDYVKINGDYRT